MSAAQGVDLKAVPETPRKRGAIDDLVRDLRDELNLTIVPRDLTYSPSAHNNSTGDALYDSIKFLYWQDRETLNGILKACSADFAGHLNTLTSQGRTEWVLQKLRDVQQDAKWLAQHRIRQSPLRTSTAVPTRTPSSLQTKLRSLRRVDSGATTQSPTTPISPMARKVKANAEDTAPSTRESSPSRRTFQSEPVTANTSFTTNITGSADEECYGSSWTPSQVEVPRGSLHHAVPGAHLQKSITPASAISPGGHHIKRMRSDEFEDVANTPTKKSRQNPGGDPDTPRNEHFPDGQHKTKDRHYQITAQEKSASVVQYPWTYDKSLPFAVSVERARMVHQTGMASGQASKPRDRDGARALLNDNDTTDFQHSHSAIWDLLTTARDPKLVLCGRVDLNPKSDMGRLFQTSVQPVRKEPESTHLERHFGWDRLFTLTIPSFTQNLPTHLQGQGEAITSAFMSCITKPQHFMGRVWRCFYTKEIITKIGKRRVIDSTRVREFLFFAVSGDGIENPIPYFDFIDWMLPFKENITQSIHKLFSRIALYVSRTKPTIQFRYDQIRFVDDIVANGEAEDNAYEDPVFNQKCRKKFDTAEVMTDGCAKISVGAAVQICSAMGITERPSTFQARVNGHKGVWHISDSYDTQDPSNLSVWIEIRPSQNKVEVRDHDRDVSSCEHDRWSFNVVDYTRPPRCSELHRDFLQVLEDRHVPRSIIFAMIQERFELDRKGWNDAMGDPAKWAVRRDEHFRLDGKQRILGSGLPHTAADKTELLMDEAGYLPKECATLAEAMLLMQELHSQRSRSQLSFSCPKSTFLVGIADPGKLLAPGTIHLSLSRPLVDKMTGNQVCGSFAGRDVLIARHPTLRNSDTQKVRCISHPGLAHLKDVVVMPTRGQIPLAAKLQGGDYDGDKFWICADERLVQPFMNAPVLEQAGPGELGIKQETQRLEDLVGGRQFWTDKIVEDWLGMVLPFACREKQLGAVTNYFYNLIYHCSLSNPGVRLVADLHDLIIDADKNGYVFDQQDFGCFRRDHRDVCLDTSKLQKPAYRENIESVKFENGTGSKQNSLRSVICPDPKRKPKNKHILDALVFEVLNPKMYDHLESIHQNYVKPAQDLTYDDDLQYVLRNVPEELIEREMSNLNGLLNEAFRKWGQLWHSRRMTNRAQSDHEKALQDCVDFYNSIQPVNANDFWNMRHGPMAPATWDCVKVGVLASRSHYGKKRNFMLWVATDTVRYLKAMSKSGMATINQVKAVKKPKAPKDWAQLDAAYMSAVSTDVVEVDDDDDDNDDNDADDDDLYPLDLDEETLDALSQLS